MKIFIFDTNKKMAQALAKKLPQYKLLEAASIKPADLKEVADAIVTGAKIAPLDSKQFTIVVFDKTKVPQELKGMQSLKMELDLKNENIEPNIVRIESLIK